MELKVINKIDNGLLCRKEIEAEATFLKEPTPNKADIAKKIAAAEKVKGNLVVVKGIDNKFDVGKASVVAYVYESEEKLKDIEPKVKEKPEKPAGEAKEEQRIKDSPTSASKEAKEPKKEETGKVEEKKEDASPSKEAAEQKKEDKQ